MHLLILPNGGAKLIRQGKPVHLSLEAAVERILVESETEMDE